MDNEFTKMELEMDLVRLWLDKKTMYEVWKLLPKHMKKELITIILKDNKEEKKWKL